MQVTQKDGERHSSAAAFIHPNLDRPNLQVRTGAHTTRVRFDRRRATAVDHEQGGQARTVRARREVIMSAGAFGTPQILMASGLGPGAHLQGLGITPVLDVAGIGQNLQDHIAALLIYRSLVPDHTVGISPTGVARLLKGMWAWQRHSQGPHHQLHRRVGRLLPDQPRRRGVRHGDGADRGHRRRPRPQAPPRPRILGPPVGPTEEHRRGAPGQPRYPRGAAHRPPLLQPPLRHGDLGQGNPDRARHHEPRGLRPLPGLIPYDRNDPAQIKQTLRAHADTEYHVCGTAKMGPTDDPLAVVDSKLRVRGIEGLRIADASVMPSIPSNNINAAALMIGEKCAEMIKHPSRPTSPRDGFHQVRRAR